MPLGTRSIRDEKKKTKNKKHQKKNLQSGLSAQGQQKELKERKKKNNRQPPKATHTFHCKVNTLPMFSISFPIDSFFIFFFPSLPSTTILFELLSAIVSALPPVLLTRTPATGTTSLHTRKRIKHKTTHRKNSHLFASAISICSLLLSRFILPPSSSSSILLHSHFPFIMGCNQSVPSVEIDSVAIGVRIAKSLADILKDTPKEAAKLKIKVEQEPEKKLVVQAREMLTAKEDVELTTENTEEMGKKIAVAALLISAQGKFVSVRRIKQIQHSRELFNLFIFFHLPVAHCFFCSDLFFFRSLLNRICAGSAGLRSLMILHGQLPNTKEKKDEINCLLVFIF